MNWLFIEAKPIGLFCIGSIAILVVLVVAFAA